MNNITNWILAILVGMMITLIVTIPNTFNHPDLMVFTGLLGLYYLNREHEILVNPK